MGGAEDAAAGAAEGYSEAVPIFKGPARGKSE